MFRSKTKRAPKGFQIIDPNLSATEADGWNTDEVRDFMQDTRSGLAQAIKHKDGWWNHLCPMRDCPDPEQVDQDYEIDRMWGEVEGLE